MVCEILSGRDYCFGTLTHFFLEKSFGIMLNERVVRSCRRRIMRKSIFVGVCWPDLIIVTLINPYIRIDEIIILRV